MDFRPLYIYIYIHVYIYTYMYKNFDCARLLTAGCSQSLSLPACLWVGLASGDIAVWQADAGGLSVVLVVIVTSAACRVLLLRAGIMV